MRLFLSLPERIELRGALQWRRQYWQLFAGHSAQMAPDEHEAECNRLLAALELMSGEVGEVEIPLTTSSAACLEAAVLACGLSGESTLQEIGVAVRPVVSEARDAIRREA